ncbi:MAG: FGGY family carbohydrate kinase [Bacteroidota bacterium]
MKTASIAIFDIGKTNKKLFLFNEEYEIIYEKTESFAEILDEDGFWGEDVSKLTNWLLESWEEVLKNEQFDIKALNFSGYGATLVQVDAEGNPVSPLYNYLKPFDPVLLNNFYTKYGGEIDFPKITASPILGNLNSGMQLYRLKYERPAIFEKTYLALHLPQYLSSVFTKKFYSEITSIGCHTNLWDFVKNKYHDWVKEEKIDQKLAPINASNFTEKINNVEMGIGLHDSSSALIPYLKNQEITDPFILISTGTWCISLNPFNNEQLNDYQLSKDCLSFLQINGMHVKASRLFAGQFHEDQTARIAHHFNIKSDFYKSILYDLNDAEKVNKSFVPKEFSNTKICYFEEKNLDDFNNAEEAYYQLIYDLVKQQVFSLNLIIANNNTVSNIFVDGGFSKNTIFMNLLAEEYPQFNLFGAEVAQASALGAALVIHEKWNSKSIPFNLISIKKFSYA